VVCPNNQKYQTLIDGKTTKNDKNVYDGVVFLSAITLLVTITEWRKQQCMPEKT